MQVKAVFDNPNGGSVEVTIPDDADCFFVDRTGNRRKTVTDRITISSGSASFNEVVVAQHPMFVTLVATARDGVSGNADDEPVTVEIQ
jgi:hypothetical protein